MKLRISFRALTRGNLIVLSIELGALYWIIASGIDVFLFQRGSLFQQIFKPELHEIWMRGFVLLILIIFGAIIQAIIAKRERAEQALREQRSKAQKYLDIAGVMFVALDERGEITLINKKGCRVLGYTDEELLGKNWFETCLPKGTREKVRSVYQKLMAGEVEPVEHYENPAISKSGEERIIAWHNTILRDDYGKIIGTISSGEDITERKRAEEALRESEERHRAIFETAEDSIFTKDCSLKYTRVNPAMEKLFGISAEELIGKSDVELFGEEVGRHIIEDDRRVLDGEIIEKEYTKLVNGIPYAFHTIKVPLRDSNGDIIGLCGIARDITDRKKAEKTMRLFLHAAARSVDGIAMSDLEGRSIYVNEAFVRMFGYAREELIRKKPSPICPADQLARLEEAMKATAEGGWKGELVGRKKDGELFPMVLTSSRVVDDEGNAIAQMAIYSDITERKQAEQNQLVLHNIAAAASTTKDLKELFNEIQKELGTIVDTTNFYIALYDKESDTISLPHMSDDKDEFTSFPAGKTLTSYVIKKGKPLLATEEVTVKLVQAGEVETIGTPSKVWLGVPLIIEKEVIGVVAVQSYTDASAYSEKDLEVLQFASGQIAIAIERKRAEEALRESEAQYRSLIENSNDGIYLLVGGKFEIINRRFSEIFDVTPEEARAPDFDFMQLIAPRSRSLIEERRRMQEQGGEPFSRYEFTGLRKDGKEIDLEASVTRIPYRGGMATQGILRDITERKKMEIQLRQTQKMEAMGTLAGGIAHDFNNILMAMLGYSDMAKYDIPEDSPARVSLKAVFEAGERAKDLVKQILTFSRQTEHELQPVKIHPIVKEALKLLRASLPTTIEIRQNIDTSCGVILADPTQIHQVMMNLCTNAYHAMREKGGILDVSLENVEVDVDYAKAYLQLSPGKYIRLFVSDTGCGMDKATLARIFDPFFTTKSAGEGTGMGLATVHGIVKSHGGAITVYSEPGKGSTFNVYFPALEIETVAEIPPDEPVTRGEESILFVDDEVQLAQLGQRMLEHLGYHVTVQTSSVDALEAFCATPDKFDLVLTDQTMPNMTGAELAEEIMHIRPDIPIILTTGFSETVTPEKARQMGISLYLNKPIVLSELGKAVRQVLDATEKEK